MNDELIIVLEGEIREEFHIPPYFEKIDTLIEESNGYLSLLVSNIDYDVDLVARDLLKNRVFYAYNNKVGYFAVDYAYDLLTWQFSKIEGVGDE